MISSMTTGPTHLSLRSAPLWALAALCTLALACGDDLPPRPPVDGGPRVDSGVDLGPVDGGSDDGGTEADGGANEVVCSVGDRIALGTDMEARDQRVALAVSAGGTLAAWRASDADSFTNVFARLLGNDGSASEPVAVTDDFSEQDSVHAVRTASGYIVAWYGNVPGFGFEIATRPMDASGSPSGPEQVVTEGDAVRHDNPALAFGQEGPVLVFVRDDTRGDREVFALALNDDGTADGAPVSVLGEAYGVGQPVLIERPASAPLLFSTDIGLGGVTDERAVWLQPLTSALAPSGEPRRVDLDGNAAGNVAAAVTPSDDVGVVFDVRVASIRNEVHYRPVLAGTSEPVGLEEVPSDVQTRDPGIAAIAGGFAVGYRRLEPSPAVELAFVGVPGEVLGTLDLGATTEFGGPISVATTADGRLWVAWAERGETETAIVAARVTCE